MTHSTGAAPPRDRFIDGLRGLALGGVLVVNSMSFPHVFSSPIGVVDPPDSSTALAVHAFCAAVFQAKSYPLLMFLVGYAWAMRVRRRRGTTIADVASTRRRQMLRQGMLGVLHGMFVYFGDILSWLALLGVMLIGAPRVRLRRLCARFRLWGAIWLLFGGATCLWLILGGEPLPGTGHWLTDARSWSDVFALQRIAYASFVFQVPWQVPMMLALGTLGVLAGRLRILERARLGARVWRLGVSVALPIGIVANALLALWVIRLQRESGGDLTPSDLSSQFAGPVLALGLVCLLAREWHAGRAQWLGAFVPLGRMTMSCYIAHTLTCMVLFAGPAGALAPRFGSVGLFGFGLAFWVCAVALAPVWQAQFGTGPLERWVRAGWGRPRAPSEPGAGPSPSRRNTIT
ncbi:MAG: DUF418 domain-containing protein [Proteobacteria bacterium]|nr:DUF418 domain-containing protein [Burkholderiales bacterium]